MCRNAKAKHLADTDIILPVITGVTQNHGAPPARYKNGAPLPQPILNTPPPRTPNPQAHKHDTKTPSNIYCDHK